MADRCTVGFIYIYVQPEANHTFWVYIVTSQIASTDFTHTLSGRNEAAYAVALVFFKDEEICTRVHWILNLSSSLVPTYLRISLSEFTFE